MTFVDYVATYFDLEREKIKAVLSDNSDNLQRIINEEYSEIKNVV